MPGTEAITFEQARTIEASLSALEGVAGLWPGAFGQVALLYAGDRVPGLRLVDGRELEVYVIVDLIALGKHTDLRAFSERVRAVASAHTDLTVSVILADARDTTNATDTAGTAPSPRSQE